MQKKQRLLLGAHMSIAGGLEKSIERGESINCTTIQIFTKSNRQWNARPLTSEEINLFKNKAASSQINPIVAHTSYLINIGAYKKETYEKSKLSLTQELLRCQKLGIPYLVLHPGAYTNGTKKNSLETIARTLDDIFLENPSNIMILLENMAGQGTTIGSTLEQLATIYDKSKFKERIGICFDTCHAWAAGYDLSNKTAYNTLWKNFDEILGMNLLKCIHLNDSKNELYSNVDRHEHIGKGKMGIKSFTFIMNDQRLFNIPKILETPKEKGLEKDKENMLKLIDMISTENRKNLLI